MGSFAAVKNASWIIGCKLAKAVLTLIVTMLTARYLGPSNYGLINYAASIVTFVTPIMKLGLDSIIVHVIINNPDKEGETLGTVIIMNLISSFLCIIGIIAFVMIANSGEMDTLIVCILYSLLLIFQSLEMIQYWFQAKLKSKYSAISMLIAYIIITVFQIILLTTGKNVYWFAVSNAMEYSIIALLLLLIYKKIGHQKLAFSFQLGKEMFKKSKYYIVSSMMVTIFAQTDRIMLKIFIDNSVVGYYSAASTCASMMSFVFAAIIDSARPIIFKNRRESIERFNKSLTQLYSIIIYLSLFVSLGMTTFAPLIINILYGSQYEESISALRLIVWYTTFSYMGTIRNIWILAESKQKYLWRINLSGALLNIFLNALLIPGYGINGAAFASLVTQIFTNFIIGFIIRPIKENNRLMVKSLNPQIIFYLLKQIKNRKKYKDIKT